MVVEFKSPEDAMDFCEKNGKSILSTPIPEFISRQNHVFSNQLAYAVMHLLYERTICTFKACLIFPQAGSISWRRRKSPNLNRNLTVPTSAGTRKPECLPSSLIETQKCFPLY